LAKKTVKNFADFGKDSNFAAAKSGNKIRLMQEQDIISVKTIKIKIKKHNDYCTRKRR
jgi:hypothetical protein